MGSVGEWRLQERIGRLEDKSVGIIQSEQQRK